ncbi:hypothetical protein [Alkalicoccobacillus gibsonii]|uniref:hypothetical protein n=1 Tax=Alkalicoccobacillus gibsonii TaxID=79881 RepID=UPI001932B825|nr:hypothetical protein [Alkalicoccobacillus gibsonii]MBM0067927.1 hypothetical protein [Alkalicoccobacillus gibsonii]
MAQDQPYEVKSTSNSLKNPQRKEEKSTLHFRRNIKLPDNVFYRLKALQNVLPYKQYELIEKMINAMVADLSERDQQYFIDQLAKITAIEEEKKQGK